MIDAADSWRSSESRHFRRRISCEDLCVTFVAESQRELQTRKMRAVAPVGASRLFFFASPSASSFALFLSFFSILFAFSCSLCVRAASSSLIVPAPQKEEDVGQKHRVYYDNANTRLIINSSPRRWNLIDLQTLSICLYLKVLAAFLFFNFKRDLQNFSPLFFSRAENKTSQFELQFNYRRI